MKYLLDANILTELEDRRKSSYQSIRDKIAALSSEDQIFFSIVFVYEYWHSIAKAPSEDMKINLERALNTFLELFSVLPLTVEGAKIYGEIKTGYEKYTGIGKNEIKRHTVDFILAGTAIEIGAVVVSEDRIFQAIREFYPSLHVENWKKK